MRQRFLYLAFFLLPLAAYLPVVINEYGKVGDFAVLEFADSAVDSASGSAAVVGESVLFRAMLDTSFKVADRVELLWMPRLFTIVLLVLLGILLWRQLDNSGWPEIDSAVVGLVIILLPAAQAMAGWAICWPRAVALVFAVAGFSAVEAELEAGGLKRAVAILGGVFIYALSAMIRPELALFGIVPLAAVLLFRIRKAPTSQTIRTWLTLHLGTLGVGWIIGRALESWASGEPMLTGAGILVALRWLVVEAVPNALALLPLSDDRQVGAIYFWPVLLGVVAAIYATFKVEQSLEGEKARTKAVICLAVLPAIFALAILLAGQATPTGYRDGYALAGLTVVALVAGWRSLLRAKRIRPWVHYSGLALLVLCAVLVAHHHVGSLIARPRALEWEYVRAGVAGVSFKEPQRIHLILSGPDERLTRRGRGDEFGAMSGSREDTVRRMVAAALRQRFPTGLPKGGRAEVSVSTDDPAPGTYDVLIDLRKLRPEAG